MMTLKTKFDKRLVSISPEILTKIARIDELKGQWTAGANLNPYLLGRLKRSVLITSAGASTRIEGAKLSDEDVEKLMQGIAMQKFADRDLQEVQGYYELLQNVFNSWESIKFSENTIKHFHQGLLKYAEKDKFHRGRYKSKENKVEMVDGKDRRIGILLLNQNTSQLCCGDEWFDKNFPEGILRSLLRSSSFDTTPAYLTSKQMQELTQWTKEALNKKKYHPLLIVGNFLVEFLSIHQMKI